MDAVCKLISKTISTDDVGFPIATETEYETFCSVESVTRAEFFNAGKAGMTPEYKITVNAVEYDGQPEVEYEGKRYTIYRTFRTDEDFMELYAEYRSGVTDIDRTPAPQENPNGNNNQSGTITEHDTEHATPDTTEG